MYKQSLLFTVAVLFAGSTLANGMPHLTGDKLKNLFVDKTQYCDQVGKERSCKTYNASDGSLVRVMDADGARREGKWWISDDDHYCVLWEGKENDLCFLVYEQEDGSYHMYKKGKHKAIIRNLAPGNPEGL